LFDGFSLNWADTDNKESQSECTEKQKNAPAGESGNQRPKRRKDKLIRLDDLIPNTGRNGRASIAVRCHINPAKDK